MRLRPLLIVLGVFVVTVAGLALLQPHLQRSRAPPYRPGPLSFRQVTPAAQVELRIDQQIGRYPVLPQRLYRNGVQELRSFADQAAEDQARLARKGKPVRPYRRTIAWTQTAATRNLVSVEQAWFDDTGGAHPDHGAKGLIWSLVDDQEIPRSALFRPGADQARLDRVLCLAIRTEKARRPGAASDDRGVSCPKWADSQFVLAPSTAAGKIGGLTFLFDPYSIGPSAEGGWTITVPLAAFRGELSAAYAREFAGAPAAAREGPPQDQAAG